MRVLLGTLVLLTVAACSTGGSGSPGAHGAARSAAPARPSTSAPSQPRPPRVFRVRLARWRAPQPVSRAAVVPTAGHTLLLAGGLVAGSSTSRVYALDTTDGRVSSRRPLAVPTHDAAAMALPRGAFVLGGGQSTTVDLVQPLGKAGNTTGTGHLPRPRSDCAAVVVNGTGYLVGGYDGSHGDAAVLATRNGRTFRRAGTLPVPVRYPAVAYAGGGLLVMGGRATSGPHVGAPVDLVQRLDLRTGHATVVGHLPTALQGAVAATLAGRVYLAGGSTSADSSAPASRIVYRVAPRTGTARPVGRLPRAVANAGIAVRGDRAWIIGGESGGGSRATVQVLAVGRTRRTPSPDGTGSTS